MTWLRNVLPRQAGTRTSGPPDRRNGRGRSGRRRLMKRQGAPSCRSPPSARRGWRSCAPRGTWELARPCRSARRRPSHSFLKSAGCARCAARSPVDQLTSSPVGRVTPVSDVAAPAGSTTHRRCAGRWPPMGPCAPGRPRSCRLGSCKPEEAPRTDPEDGNVLASTVAPSACRSGSSGPSRPRQRRDLRLRCPSRSCRRNLDQPRPSRRSSPRLAQMSPSPPPPENTPKRYARRLWTPPPTPFVI